jgi:hypothetical protein
MVTTLTVRSSNAERCMITVTVMIIMMMTVNHQSSHHGDCDIDCVLVISGANLSMGYLKIRQRPALK